MTENPVELIREFGAIPVGGALAFLMWKMITLLERAIDNHMNHIQDNTECIKDGINEVKVDNAKIVVHLERHSELLQKLIDK